MKACSRRNKATLEKCGAPFEGSGSYCRECRNEYQKEYYAMRRDHPQRVRTTDMGISCDVCGVGLRSNTLEVLDLPNDNWKPLTLCHPCKATITYAGASVDEETTEALVDAIVRLSNITHAEKVEQQLRAPARRQRPFEKEEYVQVTQRPLITSPVAKPSAEEMEERHRKNEALIEANLARGRAQSITYKPTVLQEGNFVACGGCEEAPRDGKKYCQACADENEIDE